MIGKDCQKRNPSEVYVLKSSENLNFVILLICLCAFFENKWMKGKILEQRNAFFATRYIDDVLCIINKSYPQWKELAEDYKKNCYPKELELTEDDNTHFLECEIIPNGTRIESKHWNKNAGLLQKKKIK